MTRKEQRTATRAKIVAIASEQFHRRGYEAVTLRSLAALANLSTGALFTYWPGKDALWKEVVGRPAPDFESFLKLLRDWEGGPPWLRERAHETLRDLKGEG